METPYRIEPTRLESYSETLANSLAEVMRISTQLAQRLNPATAATLAELLRLTNSYYSNLIEGNVTRPRDIERALAEQLGGRGRTRDLQREAAAHVRVQREIDERYARGELGEPAAVEFIRWIHRSFYEGAPEAMLRIERSDGGGYEMVPGELRREPGHDTVVGRHRPPSSSAVVAFMQYFEEQFRLAGLGGASKVVAIAIAHHRFNYIHPFPDGNGRVSRLMSHAMAQQAGIGAYGLWSISRGLSRGLPGRPSYKAMMDATDAPRTSDLDGRGNLSLRALVEFTQWFCDVVLDQLSFMNSQLELDSLELRLASYVERDLRLPSTATRLAREVLLRGEVHRGEAARITGLRDRAARDVLRQLVEVGLLASATPKGPVSLRVSSEAAETLFPRLF
ncbi:MAG TPA: Fic family protein [Polyangiaceae bacterium]|nr:Fic family protein [Polyangiaceae bacterium]